MYILLVGPAKVTLSETEIIQGVQQISLAHAIIAANANDPFPEPESGLGVVLELEEGYLLD
jgi:hypothetical protein